MKNYVLIRLKDGKEIRGVSLRINKKESLMIIKDMDNFYLGKFNSKLERVARSNEKIESSTFITFYKDYIYINSVKKEIIVLDKNNLNLVDTVKP